MNNLLLRTISGIGIILIVLGALLISEYSMLGLTMLIFSLSINEFRNIFRIKDKLLFFISLIAGISILVISFLFLANNLSITIFLILVIFLITFLLLYYLLLSRSSIKETGYMLFGVLWLSLSLSFFMAIGWINSPEQYKPWYILILQVMIWVNDTGAYLLGSTFGKRLLAPSISPGKTWEGFFSGIVLSALTGLVIFKITDEYSAFFWIFVGIIVSLCATGGDLFESKLKRHAEVKDSGRIIPGHGGVLDRFDSLIFTSPIYYTIFLILIILC